jgi:general secretion pathway protein E
LDASQRESFWQLPRRERLEKLAEWNGFSSREMVQIVGTHYGVPIAQRFEIDESALPDFPIRLIHAFGVVPMKAEEEEGPMMLAACWPLDDEVQQWLYALSQREFQWVLVDPEKWEETITRHFGVGAADLSESIVQSDGDRGEVEEEDENAAIIRFVNEIIAQAVRDRATDIHFEPRKDVLRIRYRIDGRLIPVQVPPNLVAFQSAIISRIKIMARLNISEKRRPQDGRITYGGGRSEIDVRVSTLPTMYGESISMRLLNEQSQPITIKDLGFLPEDEKVLHHVLNLPHGILLITGPTGSGKSTTLSAFMRILGTPERRVITVEDPIEYEIPEVNQTQVNPDIGLTFASALRSVLRQDPDVIMVGEIRDRETADIAVRASLTGHLVLSTLHTNDAPGAITRLVDMEIEPFLIASSVELVIAQRLIRRLCLHCAEPETVSAVLERSRRIMLGLPAESSSDDKQADFHKPKGCEHCRYLGYRGRVGIFEILRVDESLHTLITNGASAREIRHRAVQNGMRSLQASGWEHIRAGLTSFAEVMRYADANADAEGEPVAEDA